MTDGQPAKFSMPKLTTRSVHAIGVVGLMGLAGAGYALGFAPSARAQQQAELSRRAILKANDEARATEQHLENARVELAALRDNLVQSTDQEGSPTDIVIRIASDHALSVHSVLAGEAARVDGLVRVSVGVHASGTFSDIMGYLESLRESAPGIAVDGISIMQDPAADGTLMFQASLSAYAPQSAPTDSSQPVSPAIAPATAQPDR